MSPPYRRRVGTVRPSHLMFTGGVGALVDLPNVSVLVSGLDDWSYDNVPDARPIEEPRLLQAVRAAVGATTVEQLRSAPWVEDTDNDPNGPANRIGVPVQPFPRWLRCTRCETLGSLDSGMFSFENAKARRPDEARFTHANCGGRSRLAVPARFLLACTAGHLDDFPYAFFVHRNGQCPAVSHPTLIMSDQGGNLGANVQITCRNCKASRNIREAMGARGRENLPRCRGRHPHLSSYEPCEVQPMLLVVGASNTWFASTLSVLSVPRTAAGEFEAQVEKSWETLQKVATADQLPLLLEVAPSLKPLQKWSTDDIFAAVEARRARGDAQADAFARTRGDLLQPEWEIFTAKPVPVGTSDFTLRDDAGVASTLRPLFRDVVQVERLREVRALVGFTRLDAPDPEDPDLVQRAPLSRNKPSWVPASEVRGEGLFLRVEDDLLADWEGRSSSSAEMEAHRTAFGQFRQNRYSDRISSSFDPMYGWPGPRYLALHTLSHLLIRTIALECGYSSASLSERIYAGTESDPRSGILIYTAVPDAEGTLGGLVSLGEPATWERIVRRALVEATRCSSDPLCAERLPSGADDFLHGAACHICLFVSETTCERGNRFLDRRFVVPVGDPKLALVGEDLLP